MRALLDLTTDKGRRRANADGPDALAHHFACDHQRCRVSHHPARSEGRSTVHTTHLRRSTTPPTVTYRLPVWHGWAALPVPTQEYGGLTRAPRGFRARIVISDARDIGDHTARELAAALTDCSDYQVHGTDPHGLAAVAGLLAALLGR
ncbi:hypothetical protein ABZ611_04075 [Streptomyces sp. NPDC007861]|uniref:hypothetical protein n=1 Tax=Streptomyces sp. NPDC007861 TaxID=3154893 RepID=UPI0033C192F5